MTIDNIPIIISVPHSGLNAIRYCVEFFTDKRTVGKRMIGKGKELAFYRTHCAVADLGWNKCLDSAWNNVLIRPDRRLLTTLILLLRNPVNFHVRNGKRKTKTYDDTVHLYMSNIQGFEDYPVIETSVPISKHVFYYEDFISDQLVFKKLLATLGINKVDDKQLDIALAESQEWYNRLTYSHE